MIKAELKNIRQSKMLLVTTIAICCIPVLYAVVFLKGIWDPYSHLDQLKVAVVNQDQPVSYQGKTMNLGQKVVDSLHRNHTFDWQFVDEDEAKQGMKDNKYYLAVTIPADFSHSATTVTQLDPQQLKLRYQTNASLNYPIETVASTAVSRIKSQISAEITTTYANALIDIIKQSGQGLQTASAGAGELSSGAGKLSDGLVRLSNGTDALAGGSHQLASGSAGLADGVDRLANQTLALGTGMKASLPQLDQLNNGASSLAKSLQLAGQQTKAELNGLSSSLTGLDQLKTTAGSSLGHIGTILSDPDIRLAIARKAQSGSNPQFTRSAKALAQLDLAKLQASLAQLPDVQTATNHFTKLTNGLDRLTQGANQLADGTNRLASQLHRTSDQLNSPLTRTKLHQLASGASRLNSGITRLDANIPTLKNGVNQLASGANQLADGSELLRAKLQSGADTIAKTPLSGKTARRISQPVTLEHQRRSQVPNYAHGLAPYFFSVAIFVGCLVFCSIYPVERKADRQGSWRGWYLSKVTIGAGVATAMALIMGVIMQGVGFHLANPVRFYAILILYANAMMFLNLFLAISMGNIGRFIGMVIMILSLGSAGGTFPIETSPGLYQALHQVVPMAYSLTTIRSAIAGGITESSVTASYIYMTVTLVISLSLLAFAMSYRAKHQSSPTKLAGAHSH